MVDASSDAERAGAAIGGVTGAGLILAIWTVGGIILNLAALMTQPRK